MTQDKIDRINALARKSREPGGLTPEETAERQTLRQEYLADIRASLKNQLDHTSIQEPDGSVHKLKPKDTLPKS